MHEPQLSQAETYVHLASSKQSLLLRPTPRVQANFGGKRHELNVSTYQMCILLLFNETDRLSYGDIREATQIAPAELKRNLQSLACVKVRRLVNYFWCTPNWWRSLPLQSRRDLWRLSEFLLWLSNAAGSAD